MADNSKEYRMKLALEAFRKGHFSSRNAAARAYDVPLSTFKTGSKEPHAARNQLPVTEN